MSRCGRVEYGAMPLLQIEELKVHYDGPTPQRPVRAVDGLSLSLERGETYALVGESGCGKSATGFAVVNLVEPGRIAGGAVRLEGRDLLRLNERELRQVRGGRIGVVFQEASAALNPVMRIGNQIAEVIRLHCGSDRSSARREAVDWLARVAFDDPEAQSRAYPHELSGGMQQRAMIAIALAGRPDLLIADEPTTALDVTIQAQILTLLSELKAEMGLTVLFITHDLAVVAETADRVGVMYAGRLVEEGLVAGVLRQPSHPYTEGLLNALPQRAPLGQKRLPTLEGVVPDPTEPPHGCRFHPRCPKAFGPCATQLPREMRRDASSRVACHLHDPVHDPETARNRG